MGYLNFVTDLDSSLLVVGTVGSSGLIHRYGGLLICDNIFGEERVHRSREEAYVQL